MATKQGFEEIYKNKYIYKYNDKSNNTYYTVFDINNKFICIGKSITEAKHKIDTLLSKTTHLTSIIKQQQHNL